MTVPAKPPIFLSGGVKPVVDSNLVPLVPSFSSAGTREPDSAVKLPNIAIRLPETTTRLPETATRPSEIAIKPATSTDAMPEVIEENNGSDSHLLADVSMPETTTNIPVTTSGLSKEETSVDIRLPDVVSQVLDAATLSPKLPKNATKGPESTHNAAEVATQVPGLTIEIPSTGTKVPELTTPVPKVAPQVPEANNVVSSEPVALSSDIDNEITSDEENNEQVIDFSGELKIGQ